MIKIGINGLGRIGRLVLRAALEDDRVEVMLVNTPGDPKSVAHLLNYDSVHGRATHHFSYDSGFLHVDSKKIPIYSHRNPSEIPSKNIDIMLECSGKFNKKKDAELHIEAGARKVLVSAPCTDADATIVIGVNEYALHASYKIVSVGSCTTNALAPIAKVINDNFGIETGYVTTIHAYTGDQNLVDNSHKDIRRTRSAALSMIPTKTGAANALKLVIPELDGKIFGSAVRVPVPNVSMLDMVFNLSTDVTKESVNSSILEASENSMKNILGIAEAELVSIDFNHSEYSTIFDPYETCVIGSKMVRLVSWYDNEWAFSKRMIDAAKLLYQRN